MKHIKDLREDESMHRDDEKDHAESGREYQNDQAEDTGIPGFGVEGEPKDKPVDDDTIEE